ncbi:photosystem I assembly protein Ycf3 [Synechococcus sp. MIT S9508]|nr:photosystem I assembly protein Ycf3 [Synechococcus sp. MIT S9508]
MQMRIVNFLSLWCLCLPVGICLDSSIANPAFAADLIAKGATLNDNQETVNRAIDLQKSGKHAEAAKIWKTLVEIRQSKYGSESLAASYGYNALGRIYFDQGSYSKAETYIQKALAIQEKQPDTDPVEMISTLSNLALVYQTQSLYSEAEPLFQKAILISKEKLGENHVYTAGLYRSLGELYSKQGFYRKAEGLLQQAIKIFKDRLGAEKLQTASALQHLADVYKRERLYAKAAPVYLSVLSIYSKILPENHPAVALTLNHLAWTYAEQGLNNKAEPLYRESLDIYLTLYGERHPATLISKSNLAIWYIKEDQGHKAEPLLLDVLSNFEKIYGHNHPSTADIINNLAFLYESQGSREKSAQMLKRGLLIEAELIQREAPFMARNDRLSFIKSFGFTHEASFSLASSGKSGAEVSLFARLNRQGLLTEIEKKQALIALFSEEQIKVTNELKEVMKKIASVATTPDKRKTLTIRQDAIERQLYRLLPQLKPRIVEVEEIVRVLPSDSVLIEFQRHRPFTANRSVDKRWDDERYLAMVLKSNGMIEVVDLGPSDLIDKKISKAVESIESQSNESLELIKRIGEIIIDPLLKVTQSAKTWFVSPDGELNRLPFAALPIANNGYLSDQVELRLLTTGRELLDLKNPTKSAQADVLLIADPNYDGVVSSVQAVASRSSEDTSVKRSAALPTQLIWKRLKATANEGKTIQGLVGGKLLMDLEATASIVKQTRAPQILHLATHAFYLPDQATMGTTPRSTSKTQRSSSEGLSTSLLQGESPLLRSGIALAGANRPNSNPNDDGYLTALEVAQLDWDGTELVVISACESGRGDIRAGEGVYGLKRAIAVAGARSSLLSLWKVDDSATAAFMESFYQRLKEGQGKGQALAETQKEFRSHAIPMWRAPYVWAAFQLSGDWRPVNFD